MAKPLSDKDKANTAEARWSRLASLCLNQKYSDLTIVCGTERYPAHRSIICPQSDYFREHCDGELQGPKTLDLTGHAATLVEQMLQFLYTGYYCMEYSNLESQSRAREAGDAESEGDDEPLADLVRVSYEREVDTTMGPRRYLSKNPSCFHAQMYAKGLFFGIPALQAYAKWEFRSSLHHTMFYSFRETVEEVYSMEIADQVLKDSLVKFTLDDLSFVWNEKHPILDYDDLASYPEFTLDLCVAMIKKDIAGKQSDNVAVEPEQST